MSPQHSTTDMNNGQNTTVSNSTNSQMSVQENREVEHCYSEDYDCLESTVNATISSSDLIPTNLANIPKITSSLDREEIIRNEESMLSNSSEVTKHDLEVESITQENKFGNIYCISDALEKKLFNSEVQSSASFENFREAFQKIRLGNNDEGPQSSSSTHTSALSSSSQVVFQIGEGLVPSNASLVVDSSEEEEKHHEQFPNREIAENSNRNARPITHSLDCNAASLNQNINNVKMVNPSRNIFSSHNNAIEELRNDQDNNELDLDRNVDEISKTIEGEICRHRKRRRRRLSSQRGCWVFKTNIFSSIYRKIVKWRRNVRNDSFSNLNGSSDRINSLSNNVKPVNYHIPHGLGLNNSTSSNDLPRPVQNTDTVNMRVENSLENTLKRNKLVPKNMIHTAAKIIPAEAMSSKSLVDVKNPDNEPTSSANQSENSQKPVPLRSDIKIKSNESKNATPKQDSLDSYIDSSTGSGSSKSCTKQKSAERQQIIHSHMKGVRTKRLMKELHELTRLSENSTSPAFSVSLVNDCLYEWKVKLYRVDDDSLLHRDMIEFGVPFILFSISFPNTFPFQPPFLRVISPKIERGYVMEGGAICMELLTPSGWASAYTVEAVIMQLAASLVKGNARINRKSEREFTKQAAEASFRSLVRTHEKYGWVTPPITDG